MLFESLEIDHCVYVGIVAGDIYHDSFARDGGRKGIEALVALEQACSVPKRTREENGVARNVGPSRIPRPDDAAGTVRPCTDQPLDDFQAHARLVSQKHHRCHRLSGVFEGLESETQRSGEANPRRIVYDGVQAGGSDQTQRPFVIARYYNVPAGELPPSAGGFDDRQYVRQERFSPIKGVELASPEAIA